MSTSQPPANLESLGYNQFFEASRQQLKANAEHLARVVAEHKGVYDVIGAHGESSAIVTGKRMKTATNRDDYPAVGDWVVVKDGDDERKIIEQILPRQTTLRKKYGGKDEAQLMVANVDTVFIVESIDRDYSINRFERYLVLAREGGVRPIIVINKADLLSAAELTAKLNELHDRFADVDIVRTSTLKNDGLTDIAAYIKPGVTYCFLGSSGVGKSSIIENLVDQNIETKAIGVKSGRGRHTTTSRQMYFTPSGGIIIDNPGSREVGVVNADAGIREVFTDIEHLSTNCKYRDCSHLHEQGCAVLSALQSGDIPQAQYENYLKLQKETAYFEMSHYDKRRKDKQFGKSIKIAKANMRPIRSQTNNPPSDTDNRKVY